MVFNRTLVFLICLALAYAPSGALVQTRPQQEILRAASHIYYNLPNEGLVEVQCSAVPDWRAILAAEMHAEVAPDHPALKTFSQIHFWLSLDQQGSPKLTHKLDFPITDPQAQEGINQTISGTEQVLSGFSQSVAPFLFTSMLPKPEDKYSYEARGTQHLLSFKEEGSDVVLTLQQDLTVAEAKVVSPQINVTMRPLFSKTPKGFLVTQIESDYRLPNDATATNIVMKIEYATVQGLQLPSKLTVDTRAGDAVHKMVIAFADYEVKKKN